MKNQFITVLVFAYLGASLASTSSPSNDYDVGCFKQYRERFSARFYLRAQQPLPQCVVGGLWRHYQCPYNGYTCHCVYVDTGNPIPSANLPLGYYYFYRYFAPTSCPVLMETQPSKPSCQKAPLQYPCLLDDVKYAYNEETLMCEKVTGCHGFKNFTECQKQCSIQVYGSCSFPADSGQSGVARIIVSRYRYDPTTRECQTFYYFGRGGNSNNYETKWDCLRSCNENTTVSILVKVDNKRTYNLILPDWVVMRYELSLNETSDIKEDLFREIGDYVVDFVLIEDDDHDDSRSLTIINAPDSYVPEEVLEREIFSYKVVCRKPPKTGPCRALYPRWFYNETAGKCQKMVYGGCRANGNNFEEVEECSTYCHALYFPSPRELVAEPTDETGQLIHNPFGKDRGQLNERGELVYRIATPPGPTTTTPQSTVEGYETSA